MRKLARVHRLPEAALEVKPLIETKSRQVFLILKHIYENSRAPVGTLWTLKQVRSELKQGEGYGVFIGGQLIAFVLGRVSEESFDISNLATDPNFQRRGAMRLLIEHLASRYEEKCLWLEVHHKNHPAIMFYEKLGFRKVGKRDAYYRDGGHAVLFELA